MEVQKEAFSGLMEYYKLLPTQNKRDEIISTFEELISNYTNKLFSYRIDFFILKIIYA